MSHSARMRRRRRQGGGAGRWLLLGFLLLLLAGAGVGLAGVGWVIRTANDGPRLSTFTQRNTGSLTEVLASDGKTRLGWIQNDDLSLPMATKDLPQVMKDATIAIEDQRFYEHTGVDYEGIIRAAVKNATTSGKQGGSTLTMQLVRNLYTQDATRSGIEGYKRKIREARLAQELEEEHSKEWVVGKYLNTVPYGTYGGQTAIGVGAASRLYFDKSAKELTLREAAMLAGMPQAPSQYSPVDNPEGTKARRNEVLQKMAELGYITQAKADAEMAKGLGLNMDRYFERARERYVLDYVKDELIQEYGIDETQRGGFKVTTTIDLKYQKAARTVMANNLTGIGPSSAIVTVDPKNGDILTMASTQTYGRSKGKSTFNLAAQGHRQPGSSFKTMALLTALREGVNPDSTSYVSKSPMRIDEPPCGSPQTPWELKTYDNSSRGSISLTRATLSSDNSVYAQLVSDLGPDKVKETARMMGIKSKLLGVCAESLGGLTDGVSPLEMANAYATIVNGGYRNRPRVIKEIEKDGDKIKLPKRWRVARTKAFEDGVTDQAVKILQANVAGGTGGLAAIPGCNQGGKTGTTDKNIDAWFVGFTPKYATAVWVGFPGSAKISMNGMYFGRNIDGGTFPAKIWGEYMKTVVGSNCGEWKDVTEPFQSQPFMGKYAREALKDKESENGEPGTTGDDQAQTDEPGTKKPADPKPDNGTNGGGTNEDAALDPGAYETPPQGPPGSGGTQAPSDG